MVWREQRDHHTVCYVLMTNTKDFSSNQKDKILYPDVPSAIKPVPHDAKLLPIPDPPDGAEESDVDSQSELPVDDDDDKEYCEIALGQPHLINQSSVIWSVI
ncbi:hypothetical protein GDO78_022766 [Eleutherodactylus coqui]|uniref:Uncharacterized protein n=1 Tax=Eleutherodactylus coqui TaxID=57060 RepID=A0A8J6B8J9_ELECQ|nr:hypothetical protein GDO78_022766 [Eleutherodactylus coqui]